jgi:hypothetical protein
MVGVTSDTGLFDNMKENSVPGLGSSMSGAAKDLTKYRVRIQRFVIDSESYGDITLLEALWSAGLDPKDDTVFILSNKEFTHLDSMIVIVTFLEHKTKPSTWRGNLLDSRPTAQEAIGEGYGG